MARSFNSSEPIPAALPDMVLLNDDGEWAWCVRSDHLPRGYADVPWFLVKHSNVLYPSLMAVEAPVEWTYERLMAKTRPATLELCWSAS